MTQFIKRLLDNYRQLFKGVEIRETKQMGDRVSDLWSEIEERSLFLNSEVEMQWPIDKEEVEASNYPYPYKIDNTWDWKEKTFD